MCSLERYSQVIKHPGSEGAISEESTEATLHAFNLFDEPIKLAL